MPNVKLYVLLEISYLIFPKTYDICPVINVIAFPLTEEETEAKGSQGPC